jgi:hypothetical protein
VDLRVLAQLTVRDRYLLSLIGEHQVFTTGQLTALAFDSPARAQHRLLVLYRLGILDRFRWNQPAGSQPWHYTLGPVGAAIIAASRGVTPPRPAILRDRTLRLATSPRLAHLLGVNGFFTALHAHGRRTLGSRLDLWWSERKAAAEFDNLTRPDGYGRWTDQDRTVDFFLEYDTGTEPLPRLVDKLSGYADLTTAGGPGGPVLFQLPGPRREAGLHRLLTRSPVPVATTTGLYAADDPAGPAGPIWLPAAGSRRLPLIALSTPSTDPTVEPVSFDPERFL